MAEVVPRGRRKTIELADGVLIAHVQLDKNFTARPEVVFGCHPDLLPGPSGSTMTISHSIRRDTFHVELFPFGPAPAFYAGGEEKKDGKVADFSGKRFFLPGVTAVTAHLSEISY